MRAAAATALASAALVASCRPPPQQVYVYHCPAPSGSAPAYAAGPPAGTGATAPPATTPVAALTVAGVVTPSPATPAGVVSFCQTAPDICLRALRAQEATDLHQEAAQKMNRRDGKGCLADLDRYDQIETRRPSTSPASPSAALRSQCLMLSGQCDAGKQLARAHFAGPLAAHGPEQIERTVDGLAMTYCQGGTLTPRDQLLRALKDLQDGAYMTKKDVAFCKSAHDTARRLLATVQPRNDEDTMIQSAPRTLYNTAANCAARAGDCTAAWQMFQQSYPADTLASAPPAQRPTLMRTVFDSTVPRCKGQALP